MAILALFVVANTTSNSPAVCSGQWSNCVNAFGDNVAKSTVSVSATSPKTGIWQGYNLTIPQSAQITAVEVRADFFASKTTGFLNVQVSNDGGQTFGPSHVVGGNTQEQSFVLDVTNDFTWTASNLANLQVKAVCQKEGAGGNPTCSLDWMPVTVTYVPFDFALDANPNAGSVQQSFSTQSIITASLISGIAQPVMLSVSGCPASTMCTLSSSTLSPTASSILTVSTSAQTPAGSYSVVVEGVGDGLTRQTMFALEVIDTQPIALATSNPNSGDAPLAVFFTGEVTSGDAPFSYFWDFMDNSTSTAQNPNHAFSTPGIYQIAFTVTDIDGDSSTSYTTINVTQAPPPDSLPVASVSATPVNGTAPLLVSFTGSVVGGDAPLTYWWRFGDWYDASTQNTEHLYNVSGTYNASFTVTDVDGDSSTGYVLITVN